MTTPSTYVYVANARSSELHVFGLDAGAATLERQQTIALPGGVTPLAFDPAHCFLYAGLRDEPAGIASFAVDPRAGTLSAAGRGTLPDPPMFITTDRTGAFALSVSYANATLAISRVAAGGAVVSPPAHIRPTPPRPHGIAIDPTNRFVFVTALGGDCILQYVFDERTGTLMPNDVPSIPTPAGCGPRHAVFHPNGEILYVNGELDASICSFILDPDTGRLEARQTASILADTAGVVPWAAELAVRADGRFLYASERRTSTLAVFDLRGEPGALARCDILSTEDQPRAFALDPSGSVAIVAGELSNHLTLYAVDGRTGRLETRNRYAAGDKPVWVTAITLPPRVDERESLAH